MLPGGDLPSSTIIPTAKVKNVQVQRTLLALNYESLKLMMLLTQPDIVQIMGQALVIR